MYLKILFFLFLPFLVHAQFEYSNIYSVDGVAGVFQFNSMQSQQDGSVIIGGYEKAISTGKYFLFKIDPAGDLVWTRAYEQDTNGDLLNFHVDENESITLYGSGGCANDANIFLSNINPDGSVNWTRSYENRSNVQTQNFTKTQDGGYIIGGRNDDLSLSIGKVSNNGDLQWGKNLRRSGFHVLSGLLENENGEIMFYGSFKVGMSTPSRGLLGKLAADGTLSWLKSYNTTSQNANDDTFIAGVEAEDGGYFLAGSKRVSAKLDILMTKTDAEGLVEWSYSFGGLETETITDVKRGENCYYIIGRSSNYHPSYKYQLYKIGLDGSYLWGRQFGLPGDDDFVVPAFSVTTDDLLHVLISNHSDIEEGAWVLTMDSDGNASCLIDTLNFPRIILNLIVQDHPVLETSFDQSEVCDLNATELNLTTTLTCQYVAASFEMSAAAICAGQCISLSNTSIIFPNTFNWTIDGGTPGISTEENPDSICFYTPGTYEITLIASNEFNSDTVTHIIEVYEAPDFISFQDSLICPGDSISIFANLDEVLEYEWSTGSTNPQITVQDSGLYFFTASTSLCQDFTDSVYIDYFPLLNTLNIGSSATECIGDILTIDVEEQAFVFYEWSNGVIGPLVNIIESGVYSLVATGNCETTESNEIMLEFEDCSCPHKVPNAFTPDGDNINDFFGIDATCDLIDFDMEIYSRWGQKVAVVDQSNPVWDGNFNGNPAPSDVYIYLLRGVLESKAGPKVFVERGNVTLIR